MSRQTDGTLSREFSLFFFLMLGPENSPLSIELSETGVLEELNGVQLDVSYDAHISVFRLKADSSTSSSSSFSFFALLLSSYPAPLCSLSSKSFLLC